MKKKTAAVCLLVLLLCAALFSAEAASDTLTFELMKDGSGYMITGCKTGTTLAMIPAEYEGLPVKAVADRAFTDCRNLKMFIADKKSGYFYSEDGVLFTDDPVKTLVRFPNRPEEFETYAYKVPDGTKAIAPWAFSGCCNMEFLHIPEGVDTIGDYAFAEIEPPVNLSVYAPASLKKIGKNILQGQKGNVAFFTADKTAPVLKYCRSHKIPATWHVPLEPTEQTVPLGTPDLTDAADAEMTVPKKRTEKRYYEWIDFMGQNMAATLDISALQEKDAEVLVRMDTRWPSILQVKDGKTPNGYPVWEGLYGVGFTEEPAVLRGYDAEGKITGVRKVSGDFLFSLPGAVNLGVSEGSGTRLVMVPYEPVIITGPGDFPLSADKFRTGDGVRPFSLIARAYTDSRLDILMTDYMNIFAFAEQDPFNPVEGSSEHYVLMYSELGTPYLMDGIGECTYRFHRMETVLEDEGFCFKVSPSISKVDPKLAEDVRKMLEAEKAFMADTYLPAGLEIYPVIYHLDGSYPCAYTLNNPVSHVFLDDQCVALKKAGYVYAHETVHAIDYSVPNMDGLAPQTWWEGRAEYIGLKFCKQQKLKNNNNYPARYNWSFLTEEDKADFYRFYYESTNRETEYCVGYYFVKYLCDTYGDEVIGRIMTNIRDTRYTDRNKKDVFLECVTAATDPDVFQNFVRDVIR